MINAAEIVNSALSTPEPVIETEKPQEQPQQSSSQKLDTLAILARKERKILEDQKRFSEERKSFEQKQAELREKMELLDLVDNDPIEFLKRKGLSMSDLNSKYLEVANDEDIDPVTRKIADLEKQLKAYQDKYESKFTEIEEKEVNQLKEQESAQVKQLVGQIDTFLKGDTEKYELINSLVEDGASQVFELMQEMYNQSKAINPGNPTILKPEEAAEMFENYLAEEVKKVLPLKKIKNLINPDLENDLMQQAASHINDKTLNDNYRTSSSVTSNDLSEQERIEQAIKLAQQMIGG
jgi:hypothetical protein